MTTRKFILAGSGLVALAVVWYLFRPDALFINRHVNESFPAADHAMSAMPAAPAMANEPSAVGAMAAMAEDPGQLAAGRFHTNAHPTSGVATVYRLADGRRVLRLTEFTTSNGPDVRVVLVAAADVQQDATVKDAGYVDLGAMKGNVGDQNYELPAQLDLSKYRAVSIWCRRFNVNFGAAPLAERGQS